MVLKIDAGVITLAKECLSYSPETGIFTRTQKRNSFGGKAFVGASAGTIKDGYVVIGIARRQYRAHRLAWVLMTGEDVPRGKLLDHINRDRSDNRWENLRLVDRSLNNHNSDPHRNNTSGVKGVSWAKSRRKWDARIKLRGKVVLLGQFARFEDAVAARVAAEQKKLGESPTKAKPVPEKPLKQPEILPKWIDEHRDEFRANRALILRRTNTSGYPGVRLHKMSGLWHARIVVKGREISLGYFKDRDGAAKARAEAEMLHFGRTYRTSQ